MTDDESREVFTISVGTWFALEMDRATNGTFQMESTEAYFGLWQAAVEWATKRERERCLDWVYAFRTIDDKSPQVIAMIESGR